MNKKINLFYVLIMTISLIGILLILNVFNYPITNMTGLIFCIISIIGSIIMVIKKSKLAIISVIMTVALIAIWGFNFKKSYNEVDEFLTSVRKTAYKDQASAFVYRATLYLTNNGITNCDANNMQDIKVYLSDLNDSELEKNIFGNMNDVNSSYVLFKAVIRNNQCIYDRYIYFTDGKYSIGTIDNLLDINLIRDTEINIVK